MQVNVEFLNMLRDAAQCDDATIALDGDSNTLSGLLDHVCTGREQRLREMIFSTEGRPHPWLMMTINDTLVRDPSTSLRDGDRVTLGVPISGG